MIDLVSKMDFLGTPAMLTVSILVIVACMLFRAYLTSPPGPWGLPFVGYYPFMKDRHQEILTELTKKYGEVYVLNFAGQEYVHLGSLRALKEAHVTKADCFASRPTKYSPLTILFGDSTGFMEGEAWRVMRKFVVQSMRHFGIGTGGEDFRGPLLDSLTSTIEELKQSEGQVIDLMPLMTKMCTLSVHRIFLGDGVSEEDSMLVAKTYESALIGLIGSNMLLAGNIAKYFIMPRRTEIKTMITKRNEVKALLQKIVEDHKSIFDAGNPRDFIDMYLKEKKIREEKKDPHARFFSDEILVGTIIQAYGDGSFGIAFFILSLLRQLSSMPDVQDSMHEEIVREIGTETLPIWQDRIRLPYTVSVIKELLRMSTAFPSFPSLECTKNTTILGVPVSKGQVTLFNMHCINKDPKVFKDPERFDPNRFLSDTSLSTIGFGMGKRACLGESMVMLETFVYIASIFQNFTIRLDKDETVENALMGDDDGSCKVKVSLRKPITP